LEGGKWGLGEKRECAGGGMRVDGEKELEGTRAGKSQRQVGSNLVDGWMADGCDCRCRVHSRDIHTKQELECADGGGHANRKRAAMMGWKETRKKDQKETTTTVTMATSRFPPEARA